MDSVQHAARAAEPAFATDTNITTTTTSDNNNNEIIKDAISTEVEDTRNVAITLLDGLSAAQDAHAIQRVADHVSRTEILRATERSNTDRVLKALSRRLDATRTSTDSYKAQITQLEARERSSDTSSARQQLSDAVSGAESEIARCKREIETLDAELALVSVQEAQIDNTAVSDGQLKLYVYKNLGMDLFKAHAGAEDYEGCRVLCPARNDIQYIRFNTSAAADGGAAGAGGNEGSRKTNAQYASEIWGALV